MLRTWFSGRAAGLLQRQPCSHDTDELPIFDYFTGYLNYLNKLLQVTTTRCLAEMAPYLRSTFHGTAGMASAQFLCFSLANIKPDTQETSIISFWQELDRSARWRMVERAIKGVVKEESEA